MAAPSDTEKYNEEKETLQKFVIEDSQLPKDGKQIFTCQCHL